MNFRKWLNISEMAHMGMKEPFKIPCSAFQIAPTPIPCADKPVAMIDMRFEDPGAYRPPYNKLGNFSKFAAMVPGKNEYLVYHGGGWADIVSGQAAIENGFIPTKDNKIDNTPGAVSSKGYLLVPESWPVHAQLIGMQGDVVKPALGDVPTPEHPKGRRQAFLDGLTDAKKSSDI